uniref:MD-2-related lipid-recognition domain-containing protein n=1 Tax=Acrobeloides nanus TaxID=290746 RepID=A0A914CHW2_9BILA
MDEDVAEWGGFNCQWSDLPTFDLLSNWNGCEKGIICPLEPGNQIMKFYLDFTNYQIIINLLKNDTPYQLTYIFTNRDTGDKLVFYAQARCETRAPTSASKN